MYIIVIVNIFLSITEFKLGNLDRCTCSMILLTHSTQRATIVARAQSSRNLEGHYSGRGNVINVINLK